MFGDGPVHILPYEPQCHELFAIYKYNNQVSSTMTLLATSDING